MHWGRLTPQARSNQETGDAERAMFATHAAMKWAEGEVGDRGR